MNYSGKGYAMHIFILIIVCSIFSVHIHGQTDRNELKLQNLKNKITMAESKVAAAELKMSVADSLITSGDLRISQAEENFARIGEDQKKLEKEYRTNIKTLRKLARSKDEETAKKAEEDLKALDDTYKENIKKHTEAIKTLTREANKAKSDVDKGLDMQRSAIVKLKDAQKALEIAKKNHEAFVSTLDSEPTK